MRCVPFIYATHIICMLFLELRFGESRRPSASNPFRFSQPQSRIERLTIRAPFDASLVPSIYLSDHPALDHLTAPQPTETPSAGLLEAHPVWLLALYNVIGGKIIPESLYVYFTYTTMINIGQHNIRKCKLILKNKLRWGWG